MVGIVDKIDSQHHQVKALLEKISSGKGSAKEDDFCELRRVVAVHETAEEEIVYPVVEACGSNGVHIAQERIAEEEAGSKVLGDLEKLDVGGAEFEALFAEFKQAVLDHASAEEREVFPLLKEQSPERQAEMVKRFDEADRAAPAHGHPHGGSRTMVAMPAAEIARQVRTTLRNSA